MFSVSGRKQRDVREQFCKFIDKNQLCRCFGFVFFDESGTPVTFAFLTVVVAADAVIDRIKFSWNTFTVLGDISG